MADAPSRRGTRAGSDLGLEAAAEFRLDRQALDDLFTSPDGPVGKELVKRALGAERRAKRLCPVDTGRLRSSITHALERDRQGLSAVIGTNVVYAARIEFGYNDTDSLGRTYTQPPQSFLRAALVARGLTE